MPHKILYIEDNPNNMQLVRKMLKVTDYQLYEAVDGNSGYETALKVLPDLILTDINLPDINGVEVISYLKQSPLLHDVPIIAITADNSTKLEQQCLISGAVAVMHKPISRFHLLNTIRRFAGTSNRLASEQRHTLHADLKKVLVVDDHPDLRAIFARTFDRRHFAVTIASDGVEAIERLQEELPDILILDINMPRLSGYEVLRYVRQNQGTQDLKVIVVTGNTMAMTAPEAEFADLLLIKPVSISDLVTLAQRLMPAQV